VGAFTVLVPSPHRVCLGTLIAPDRVLTAAHCAQARDLSVLRFVVGSGYGERAHRLREVRTHPDFGGDDRVDLPANDIAVVTLEQPEEGAAGEPLADPGEIERTPTIVAVAFHGGRVRDSGPPPFETAENDVLWVRASEFAAGRSGQRQACHGDSGGPAFRVDDLGRRRVIGVVSRGLRPDCMSGVVFTRVDAFIDWIDGESRPTRPSLR
jgi:secreted trypsin-like serine protease